MRWAGGGVGASALGATKQPGQEGRKEGGTKERRKEGRTKESRKEGRAQEQKARCPTALKPIAHPPSPHTHQPPHPPPHTHLGAEHGQQQLHD